MMGRLKNGANDPMPEQRIRCKHCGEIIYKSGVSGKWIHWNTVEKRCSALTVATPEDV